MASIISTPDCQLAAAYTPIIWRIQEFTVANRLPPAMKVDYMLDGSLFATVYLSPVEALAAPPQYFFEVDAQEVVQSFFNNADALPPINTGVLVSGFSVSVQIVVTPQIDEGGGFLVENTVGVLTSQSIYAINAYRKGQEQACLDSYATGFAINTEGPRPWLTRLNESIELCRNANFWLSGYNGDNVMFYTIKTFDENGNELASGGISSNDLELQQVQTLGIGPVNLNDSGGLWLTTPVSINQQVAYYTITSSYISFEPGDDIFVHRTFTVHLTDDCCEYQLVFLNSFGVYEAISVQKEQVLNYQVQGNVFSSARLLPSEANFLLSRGTQYLSKNGTNVLQFSLAQSRDQWQEWYRDFFNSPDVYLLANDQLIPVVVNTGSFNLKSNFGLVITLQWSNKDYSQRN